jgi:hypothetical protein
VTWRELTGIGLLIAGLLALSLGSPPDGSLRAAGATLLGLGLLLISWERMRRGLGPPSLAELKKEEFKDPPNSAETDWICPRCHERNPVTFELCWKCKHSRLGGATSNNRSKDRDA